MWVRQFLPQMMKNMYSCKCDSITELLCHMTENKLIFTRGEKNWTLLLRFSQNWFLFCFQKKFSSIVLNIFYWKIKRIRNKFLQLTYLSVASLSSITFACIFFSRMWLYWTYNFCLCLQEKSEDEHKLVRTNYAEDSEVLRVPIALAMIKLLQNLPHKSLEHNLPG